MQLRMLFDAKKQAVQDRALAPGFRIRPYRPEDKDAYLQLREGSEFKGWNDSTLEDFLKSHAVTDGLLLVEETATGRLAASATAEHGSLAGPVPFPGTLGWVMTSPEFRGHGLCPAVSCAAMRKMIGCGLKEMYLLTDDFRLPAVSVYLKLGWRPWLFQDDMPGRWKDVCGKLGYPEGYLSGCAVTDPMAAEIFGR